MKARSKRDGMADSHKDAALQTEFGEEKSSYLVPIVLIFLPTAIHPDGMHGSNGQSALWWEKLCLISNE